MFYMLKLEIHMCCIKLFAGVNTNLSMLVNVSCYHQS